MPICNASLYFDLVGRLLATRSSSSERCFCKLENVCCYIVGFLVAAWLFNSKNAVESRESMALAIYLYMRLAFQTFTQSACVVIQCLSVLLVYLLLFFDCESLSQ